MQSPSWDWLAFANTAIAALLGTSVGAIVVFLIENRKRRQRVEDEQVSATNVAVFALSRAWRELESFRQERIEPVRNSPVRWYSMRSGKFNSPPIQYDASALAFLFEERSPDIPAVVQIALDQYESIREEILSRTNVHVTELQPLFESTLAADPRQKSSATSDELMLAAGTRLYQTLTGLTDAIIKEVDLSLPSIKAAATELRAAAKAKFPKRKIIRFEPIPPANRNSPS